MQKYSYKIGGFDGARRKMINFGCTRAPYYDPSPRCTDDRGFHHGLDVAMPCGTKLFAGFRGWVVRPASEGALGSAYGRNAFRLRNRDKGVDVVVGHVKRVYVAPGDRVRKGQLIAFPERRASFRYLQWEQWKDLEVYKTRTMVEEVNSGTFGNVLEYCFCFQVSLLSRIACTGR